MASRRGYEEMIELLQRGLSFGDDLLEPPLVAACWHGQREIVELLLENGADVNTRDFRFSSALEVASSHSYEEVAKLLIQKGVDFGSHPIYRGSTLQTTIINYSAVSLAKDFTDEDC